MVSFLTILLSATYPFRDEPITPAGLPLFDTLLPIFFIFSFLIQKTYRESRRILTLYAIVAFYPILPSILFQIFRNDIYLDDLARYYFGVATLITFINFGKNAPSLLIQNTVIGLSIGIITGISLQINDFITSASQGFIKFNNIFFTEQNFAGSLYALTSGALLFAQTFSRRRTGKIMIALAVGLTILSATTYSRGAIITGGICWALYFYYTFDWTPKKVFMIILSLTTILFMASFFTKYADNAVETMTYRFKNLTNPYEGGRSDPRFEVWQKHPEIIAENPLGIGVGNARYFNEWKIPEHNTILQILSIFGIIAIPLFVFYASMIPKLPKASIYFLVTPLLVSSLPLNLLIVRHFWIFLALIICSKLKEQK